MKTSKNSSTQATFMVSPSIAEEEVIACQNTPLGVNGDVLNSER